MAPKTLTQIPVDIETGQRLRELSKSSKVGLQRVATQAVQIGLAAMIADNNPIIVLSQQNTGKQRNLKARKRVPHVEPRTT